MTLTADLALFAVHEKCDSRASDNNKGKEYNNRKWLLCVEILSAYPMEVKSLVLTLITFLISMTFFLTLFHIGLNLFWFFLSGFSTFLERKKDEGIVCDGYKGKEYRDISSAWALILAQYVVSTHCLSYYHALYYCSSYQTLLRVLSYQRSWCFRSVKRGTSTGPASARSTHCMVPGLRGLWEEWSNM